MDITLVHGAPCAGKNEYVQGKMQEGDVIIDADLLAQALGSPDSHNHPGHIKSLGMKLRDVAIREASRGSYKTWVVSASPRATQTIPHTSSLHLDPGMDVCLERAKTRPSWTKEAIRDYYDKLEIPEPSRFAKVQWLEVDMTLVYGTVTNVSGQAVYNALVSIALPSGGIDGETIVSTRRQIRTNKFGYWEMDLVPNSEILPANTYYVVRHLGVRMFIVVPDSNDLVPVSSLIVNIPQNPLSSATYVNDIDGHYGSISQATITAITGGGGGGGGAVSSVDGRTGIVTLNDKYATLTHTHTGSYSLITHHHNASYSALNHDHNLSYAGVSHVHDSRYVKLGEEAVQTVDGMTGNIELNGTYAPLGHIHPGGGGGAVDSVQGRTGTVTLDDLFSGVEHDHEDTYAPILHDHSSIYAALVHNHDSSYAASAHNHDATYSALGHTHTGTYSDVGHTHSFPVTSVDGLTGAVSLSSTYATYGHNHSGVYSVTSHNHDSAYSAAGHTHSYPVTSVDGLTGAVSLSSTYAASTHNHNSSYAALSHNHDSSYAALSHNHDASYATIGHTHSALTAGSWSSATMTSGIGGTLQYRSEPAYGVIRIRTNGRLYAASGSFGAGSTIATLPVGSRPATEIKWVMYQGAEPTQNLIILKLSTAGALTIVNSISLSGTQSSGIIIDHTFATS